jgi:hypothetical protein
MCTDINVNVEGIAGTGTISKNKMAQYKRLIFFPHIAGVLKQSGAFKNNSIRLFHVMWPLYAT